jgi:hypothetical protein
MVVMDCVLELEGRVWLAARVTVLLTCPSARWLQPVVPVQLDQQNPVGPCPSAG